MSAAPVLIRATHGGDAGADESGTGVLSAVHDVLAAGGVARTRRVFRITAEFQSSALRIPLRRSAVVLLTENLRDSFWILDWTTATPSSHSPDSSCPNNYVRSLN